MNGAAGEKQEAEKKIKEYIQASSMSLSKKEEQDFKELVLRNEKTAKYVAAWCVTGGMKRRTGQT